MAVKASATISIYRIKEVTSTTNYYLLQSSTAAAPSKPTTDSPGGKWTTSEPAYTDGSTLTLYTVIKTKYSDNTFEYTPVSKSTSYEAAKSAYNKAQAAQNSATSANNKIDNLEVGGRNYVINSNFSKGLLTRRSNSEGWTYGVGSKLSSDVKFDGNNTIHRYRTGTTSTSWAEMQYYHYRDLTKETNVNEQWTLSFWVYVANSEWIDVSTNSIVSAVRIFNSSNTKIGDISIPDLKTVLKNSIGKWTRYVCTFSIPASLDYTYFYFFNSPARDYDFYLANYKLEKGNKATDWTPAPEDSDNVISQDTAPEDTSAVWFNTHDNLFYKYNGEDWIAVSDYNEDISKLKDDVGKIDSTIDGKINAYNDEIKNTYYTKAQVDSQLETNERGIKEYYSGTLQTIREDTTGLSNRITAIEGYIQKGLDDNGQPFVELGTQASPYKLKITNDAIQITYLGEPVSNWKQDLIELNTVITSYLNLGKFSFVINSDDSLSFRKIR